MKAFLRLLHAPVYEKRLQVLCELLGPHLESGETLLDVGCGSGELGSRLVAAHEVRVKGLELRPRENCLIPVTSYDGGNFPFGDNAFDSVLLADVLHHEKDPAHVLREAARVAAKRVIVKDHKVEGLLAWLRISFLDWAANTGYNVPCFYQYYSGNEWANLFKTCELEEQAVLESLDLYPPGLNFLFGKRLQYLAVVVGRSQ